MKQTQNNSFDSQQVLSVIEQYSTHWICWMRMTIRRWKDQKEMKPHMY